MRTSENYIEDCQKANQANDSHGVFGKSILSKLEFYNPIESTNIDYMHSIVEGVVKKFFKIWFEDKKDNNQAQLKAHIDLIIKDF